MCRLTGAAADRYYCHLGCRSRRFAPRHPRRQSPRFARVVPAAELVVRQATMQREPLETKIHIVFAVILLVLPVPGCHRRTPLPFEGVLIAGPPIYNGAKLFLNGEYCGTLQTLQNPEPYVVQTLSYRYPDRSQSAWVGLDLTSAISVSDSHRCQVRSSAVVGRSTLQSRGCEPRPSDQPSGGLISSAVSAGPEQVGGWGGAAAPQERPRRPTP